MREAVKRNLRDERRSQTEMALVKAATELFVRDGYAATALSSVAEHAGVAARTVYVHFATKADLLQRCIGVAIGGDSAPTPLEQRGWMQAAMTAPTRDARIRQMASITAGLMDRTGPLLRVAQQAEGFEPAIAAAAQAGRDDTHRIVSGFWRSMHSDGLLPKNCDIDWLTETATLLAHADTYLLVTKTTTWDIATYEEWLTTTWRRLAASR